MLLGMVFYHSNSEVTKTQAVSRYGQRTEAKDLDEIASLKYMWTMFRHILMEPNSPALTVIGNWGKPKHLIKRRKDRRR